jgi:hypothetical protein
MTALDRRWYGRSAMSFGPPEHPHWRRFVDGMETYLTGADSPARWRWHPKDGVWYSYPSVNFILDDVGIAPTETPAEFQWTPADKPQDAFYKYNDWQLADAFRKIEAAYDGFKSRYEHAVWNPRSGEWRAALRRTAAPQPTPPPPPPPPESAKVRIAKIREAEARRLITRDDAQKLIDDILAENH